MIISNKSPISINNDPWEAYNDILEHNQLTLSNIEFTTTNLCNMRCSHCAVGYSEFHHSSYSALLYNLFI